MRDIYEQLPKLKIDLDLPKFLLIVITVMASFVIPALFISFSKAEQANPTQTEQVSGQVAGVSTSVTAQSTDQTSLISQATLMIVGGVALVAISAFLIFFLLADGYKLKK